MDSNLPPRGRRWTDQGLEQLLGNLLRAGVMLAALVTLTGGILHLVHHGREHRDFRVFQRQPELCSLQGIVTGALDLHHPRGKYVIQLGLLMLIATPVARVIFSVVGFALQRDWTYVGATLVVLATLLYSLFSG